MMFLRNLLIGVLFWATLTGISYAELVLYSGNSGVVFDKSNNQYWVRDLSLLKNQSYQGNLDGIENWNNEGFLSDAKYGEWKMADLNDMTNLWTYSYENITSTFMPTYRTPNNRNVYWHNRYDEGNSNPDWHYVGTLVSVNWGAITQKQGLFDNLIEDTDSRESVGAWVVSDGFNPVPIPGAVWLFGTGLLGIIGIKRKKD